MAITYTGTNGLFTRLGKLAQVSVVVNTFRSTLSNEIDDVYAEFTSGSAPFTHPEGPFDQWQISELVVQKDLTEAYFRPIDMSISTTLKQIIIGAVRDGLKKPVTSFSQAFTYLHEDMVKYSAGFYVVNHALTTAGTLAAGSGATGDGTILVSNKRPITRAGEPGDIEPQIRTEVIRANCHQDQPGGSGAGREVFIFDGEEARSRFSSEWPGGSGLKNKKIRVCSAGRTTVNYESPGENALQNSDFNIWNAATTCSFWTLGGSGTAVDGSNPGGQGGARVVPTERESSVKFGSRGDYNIRFNGNGAFKHSISQKTNNSDGTRAVLHPNCTYFWSARIRAESTTISSGVLRLSLFNGTSATISNTSVSVDFSSANLTTSYVHVTGEIQVDVDTLVSDTRVVAEFTTALQADRTLVMGELVLAKPVQLYPGGPSVLPVRGATDFRIDDTFTITYVNNYAGKFQKFFDQYLGDDGEFALPTGTQKASGDTEISDGLVA